VESAAQIDSVWPYKYRGSQDYIASLIESNGGYGVFLKNGDEMVAWAVKHCLGHIGMVQTRENEKKKGYGLLVTKALAKEIVEEGQRPFATIYAQNKASICMFEKLGFQKIGNCYFINQLT
jgi:predicted GNAT family acetyltransferase